MYAEFLRARILTGYFDIGISREHLDLIGDRLANVLSEFDCSNDAEQRSSAKSVRQDPLNPEIKKLAP